MASKEKCGKSRRNNRHSRAGEPCQACRGCRKLPSLQHTNQEEGETHVLWADIPDLSIPKQVGNLGVLVDPV